MPTAGNDPLLGRTIAQRYRLISRLGAGSVAEVYLARHVLIDRLGAIKIVNPALGKDPVWRERFVREARAVNRINHPNIVEITDVGEADGLLYLVMEYVPGESLRQLVDRGPLGWRRAAEIGLQIASALGRAHEMGVVHRDLKPANVLVVPRRGGPPLAKLTDFGVAKLADAAPLTVRADDLAPSGERAAAYAAPELHGRGEADARADLFALGVVLHEATSGVLPEGAPLSVHAPDVPPFFDEVVSTLLAADPADRPRDGFEAADLLRRALERDAAPSLDRPSEPPSPRPLTQHPPSIEPPSLREQASGRLDRLAPVCEDALAALEEAMDTAEAAGVPPSEEAALARNEARRLTATVRALADLTESDMRALERVEARGRATLAELGQRLDEVAREHSRALGWAGTIAERSYHVEVQRLSGEHPVPAIEAMIWEQAALEQEEDRARERAARLAAEMGRLRADIDRCHARVEREISVVGACLEGRVAALRSVAAEAMQATERAAALANVAPRHIDAVG
jgi:serine/threonine-protein kinase